MNKYIWLFLAAQFVGTILVWLQVNGQLIWKPFHDNMLLLSLFGIPISILFMKSTQWGYEGFDDKLWPVRLVGFAVGTFVFTIMTGHFMKEIPDPKTFVCLGLAFIIISIQLFVK